MGAAEESTSEIPAMPNVNEPAQPIEDGVPKQAEEQQESTVTASETCPICLHEYNDELRACHGPCGHSFCVPCLERLLTAPTSMMERRAADEGIPISLTFGQCPMCRAELSLFDLEYNSALNDNENSINGKSMVYPQNFDLTQTPLRGAIFYLENEPFFSFHFPTAPGDPPYLSAHNDGGDSADAFRHFPCRRFNYHAPTQTFSGEACVKCPGNDNSDNNSTNQNNAGDDPLEGLVQAVLTFSYDWQFVTRGMIIVHDQNRRTPVALGGNSGRLYRRRAESIPEQLPRSPPQYHRHSLWGNTFFQASKVGLASYHFVSPTECYISYEHRATSQWPPLDNGMPIPSRAPFRNVQVLTIVSDAAGSSNNNNNDHDSVLENEPPAAPTSLTVFRGQICWLQDFGTLWQGMARWEYEMVFDSEFMCILGGLVTSYSPHEACDIWRYGENLIYCNAALYDVFYRFRHDPSSHVPSEWYASSYEEYQAISASLRQRLLREGASVRITAAVHNIFTIAQDPNGKNPIDYNLASEALNEENEQQQGQGQENLDEELHDVDSQGDSNDLNYVLDEDESEH